MSRNSSQFNKQNELLRSLKKQLAATERELADQKWLLQQYLQSPSWRLTAPIRWLAKLFRALRDWLLPGSAKSNDEASDQRASLQQQEPEEAVPATFDLKECFTEFYQVQLQSFLASGSSLELPRNDAPEISVILVLFNRAELTFQCLRSLAENQSERIEIIIVDNDSKDETPLLLGRLSGARIIRNSENRNFLLAVNQAAEEARGEYLLLLNNDAQLLPGTIQTALSTIRSAPDIGGVGGRIILLDGTLQEAGSIIWRDGSCLGYGRGDQPSAPMYMFKRDVDYCSAAFLLTPLDAWKEVGGFDEIFKPAYYEDSDYCTRLWKHGLRVVYDPNAILIHYEFASSGSTSRATDLQREHQRIFSARHSDLLAEHYAPDLNSILAARMRNRVKSRVLFIDDRVPHTWLGSGFPRARTILLTLLKQESFVTFYPLTEFDESWRSVYSDMPQEIEFMMGYGPALLEPFLRNRPRYYDAIFISRPHNMKILKPVIESHPDWFDGVNIIYDAEAIFATRELSFHQLMGAPLSVEETNSLLREEIDLASTANCVVAVSETDAREFGKYGIENVRIVGHSLPEAPTARPFNERKGFLFVGAIHEEASPNGDSVIWFLEEIFPKILAVLGADVPLIIAGVNKSERIRNMAGPSVHITRHVPDLTPYYDAARVFVAPTRYAAGIPHKVHEAAARGLPIVATPLLATQLGWQDGSPFFVGANSEAFAQKCIELHQNAEVWTKLREAALDRIRKECSAEAFENNVKILLQGTMHVGMDR